MIALVGNDGVLLEVGFPNLIPREPGILMDNRIAPWSKRYAAVCNVVIFLYRTIQLTHRCRQHTWRIPRKVVAKQIGCENGKRQKK
jgi:hypothetical protein